MNIQPALHWKRAAAAAAVTLLLSGCGQAVQNTAADNARQAESTQDPNAASDIDTGGTKVNVVSAADDAEVVPIEVMTPDSSAPARANNFVKAADMLNAQLEKENAKQRVKVNAVVKPLADDDFKQNFIFASKSGNAADIYATTFSNIGWMADGDYLLNLDGIEKEAVFRNQIPGYWDAVTWDKHIWGVIQDTEARPVYYWKPALKKLGWTDEQIAALPDKAEKGEITIADMDKIAKDAVDRKIVRNGFVPTTGQSDLALLYYSHGVEMYDKDKAEYVLDKAHMTDTLKWIKGLLDAKVLPAAALSAPKDDNLKAMINGETMFMVAGVWDEAKWRTRGMEKTQGNVSTDFIMQNIGVMLMPPAEKGGKPVTVSGPWTYVVSKQTKHPELAKRLLTYVSAPELQKEHDEQSSHLPFTKEGQALIKDDAWLSANSYLINYSRFIPNDPDQPKFAKIYTDAIKNIATGKSPEETVKWMEQQMKLNLDKFTVK
ncbi:inositol-phosphate transport system substrate-binding protein [Paenibacillus sp. UNC496MF]|uniref:extracellular solute-binding protein n=1 Tax=Paenibacillus sp. UNC496MF TaxID=1502753 RepID=UPI0008E8AEF0|nr:extracellular solute-binding protein [Paenibacillus sp. UNC496MF]SFJ40541.1 inositol-phosphate transport system substrate-binding protein [Paenibacillus sp. UNC496MF]